jgi:hypothetical protein
MELAIPGSPTTTGGMASAMRQRIDAERRSPLASPITSSFLQGQQLPSVGEVSMGNRIVFDDDEEPSSQILEGGSSMINDSPSPLVPSVPPTSQPTPSPPPTPASASQSQTSNTPSAASSPSHLPFVEAISRNFNNVLLRILRSYWLGYTPYPIFERLAQTTEIFRAWSDFIKEFTNVAREMTRKRSEAFISINVVAAHGKLAEQVRY